MPIRQLLLLVIAALPLFGQSTCTYSLTPNVFVAGSGATNTSNPQNIPSFTVTTQTNCPFIATTGASWLHVIPPANGTSFLGTSPVSFTIDQNASSQLRKDQIIIYPGTQVTSMPAGSASVTQVAGICNYSVSPTSAEISVSGGSGSFAVATGCVWGTSANQNFIYVTPPGSGVGSGTQGFQVAANPCVAPRAGQITVQTGALNPPVYQITQDGSTSNLTLTTNSVTVGAAAVPNQHVTVNTGGGCPWNTYSDSSNWLHTTVNASGTGTGVYNFSVDANLGGTRTGHIYFQSGYDFNGNPVLAATLTVTQQAVQLSAPQLTAVLNGASYALGPVSPPPVSPGEIVALFGTNLGPVAGAANYQTFGTTLAGVQVMFGSTPAALIYVSSQQINAVVPYAVAGSSVAVSVQYSGGASPALVVPVQAATPGIFSYDHSGSGPGAILNNQDYSLNSAARPAAAGTVVDIYCTGAGVTAPAATDGSITTLTPPFPSLAAQPVTVTIGGIGAQVIYAGPAPGAIAGLTQIDAVVPQGAASGASVPVVVTIGGVASQGNLSMAVK